MLRVRLVAGEEEVYPLVCQQAVLELIFHLLLEAVVALEVRYQQL